MLKMGLVSYDTQSAIEELFYLAKAGTEYHSTEFKLNTKNGGFQWYFSTFSTIYDEEGTPLRVVGLLRNIHAQKVEQQKLLIRAETDQMTGLYNKATTESKIQASLRELNGNSYQVLMLVDIDDFKKINDTFGHLKGDEVIVDIAKALQGIQRRLRHCRASRRRRILRIFIQCVRYPACKRKSRYDRRSSA